MSRCGGPVGAVVNSGWPRGSSWVLSVPALSEAGPSHAHYQPSSGTRIGTRAGRCLPPTYAFPGIVVNLQAPNSPDVTVSAAVPAAGHHPAWLRAFWHYDPDYAYAPETYEYGPYSTTDPCYIEDGVRLSPNAYHDEFLTVSKSNLLRFPKLTGQDLLVTREVPVRNLPDIPLARPSRRRLEPDLGVWPAGTQVRRESMLQWEEVSLPRLVVECLSWSATYNNLVTKPDLYRDLGVEGYWVCQAHPMQVHTVYQRDDRGWRQSLDFVEVLCTVQEPGGPKGGTGGLAKHQGPV